MVRCLTPGVGFSIPPVAPADVPAITAQDYRTFTSGGDFLHFIWSYQKKTVILHTKF